MRTILGLDLGQFKSVACLDDPNSEEARDSPRTIPDRPRRRTIPERDTWFHVSQSRVAGTTCCPGGVAARGPRSASVSRTTNAGGRDNLLSRRRSRKRTQVGLGQQDHQRSTSCLLSLRDRDNKLSRPPAVRRL